MEDKDPRITVLDGVYSPREDSYLLAKAVRSHARGRVLDLGCGTGIQGIIAAKAGCAVTFVDINPRAITCAQRNAAQNHVSGNFVVSDLFSDVHGTFDTIVFNPPYVPTAPLSRLRDRDHSTDGGVMGREVIKRFLSSYGPFLGAGGSVLLLESTANNYAKELRGMHAKVVEREPLFFEQLVVLLFHKRALAARPR